MAMTTGQRRFLSSTPASSEHAFVKMRQNQQSFSKTWLSDPSTYPIIVVLGFACGMCAGVGSYYLYACKDVQISTSKRSNEIIRTWDRTRTDLDMETSKQIANVVYNQRGSGVK